MSRPIRHQAIMLQIIAGERTIEESRTVNRISGDGARNNLVLV